MLLKAVILRDVGEIPSSAAFFFPYFSNDLFHG